MSRFRHGLVLGTFYPPNAGHHHLVRTAAGRCDRLTVLVCAASVESVPLADRVTRMREVHPDVRVVGAVDDIPVDVSDPAVWDAHMTVFRTAVPEPVDAVFTSEAYGDELGRRFGAASVCVDPDRVHHPVSGTAVRKDPVGCWDFLEAPVRAAFARRVVVLGAESTGTTTMAQALAEHYRARGGVWARTRCVPEYGREYSERKLAALRAVRPGADWPDVAFEDDGLRDGEHLRSWMTGRFREELARTGRRTVELTGPHEQRPARAVAAVDTLIGEGRQLADPLPERR